MAIRFPVNHLAIPWMFFILLVSIALQGQAVEHLVESRRPSGRLPIQGIVQPSLNVFVEFESENIDLMSSWSISEEERASVIWPDAIDGASSSNQVTAVRKVYQLSLASNTGGSQVIQVVPADHYFESDSGKRVPFWVGINPNDNAVYIRYYPADFAPHETYRADISLTIAEDF